MTQIGRKWAMVAWEKLCKPKIHGGLGLKDPKLLSLVLSAKVRWQWLQGGKEI